MQTWFECKVKYQKLDQGGHERKVNDNYLIDAVSFTDAETRIYEKMGQLVRGDFQVMNIKKSGISEVLSEPHGEWWYKAKISMITIDEEAGKEKKVSNYVIVMADDINEALKNLEQGLSYMLIPYVITSIQLSTIADVFPYFEENEVQKKINTNHPAAAPYLTQNIPTSASVTDSSDEELEELEESEEAIELENDVEEENEAQDELEDNDELDEIEKEY
jgi:hypothetical protein